MIREKKVRVTQKDIARHLSVSQSLVAAVLNNRPGVWVSEENRQRIKQAAQEMHYRPNSAAQSLRNGRSRSVGMAVVTEADGHLAWETGQIIASLAGFVGANDLDLKFKFFSQHDSILEQLAELVEAGWCEVLIITGLEDLVEAQGRLLERMRMPFIVIGDQSQRHPDWYQADFDQEAMMRLSVAHLVAQGHQRLAYLGHQTTENYGLLLERGFRRSVQQTFGALPDESLMGRVRADGTDAPMASATHFLSEWLSRPAGEQPTALVFGASDDRTWREAELSLLRFGLRFGDQPGEFGATGLHHTVAPLLFGQAQAFVQTDMNRLTDALCEHLLAPLLDGRLPTPHFLRVCPALQPLPTLNLAEHHF